MPIEEGPGSPVVALFDPPTNGEPGCGLTSACPSGSCWATPARRCRRYASVLAMEGEARAGSVVSDPVTQHEVAREGTHSLDRSMIVRKFKT